MLRKENEEVKKLIPIIQATHQPLPSKVLTLQFNFQYEISFLPN